MAHKDITKVPQRSISWSAGPGYVTFKIGVCVVTVKVWEGSWYSCRWKNFHRAIGMSGIPLFMGG